ncbi:patatin-like phospholipase-like protein [Diplogelasinospora grovesii]|uniref:Patatin-like phospholipase-like protein n=1 Tax=Diplogelasinospora grovesii TaxID=303347 RepID=A0AAN6S0B2_9PEZI|nr:patatin-like phospholipase-like protein [Diplogelasinospora grovesii]
MNNIIESLPSLTTQYPALLLLVKSPGGRLLTANEPYTSASPGSIHLSLNPDTISEDNPVLIASAFPLHSRRRSTLRRTYKCYLTIAMPSSTSLIYSELLFALTNVFCFVYHHASDLNNIVQYLASWVEARKPSAVQCIPPEIVIIITKEGLLSNLARSSTEQFFSGLSFITVRKNELISSKGRSQLLSHLYKASSRVRHKRADRRLLFSAKHFIAFSKIAFNHLLLPEPFKFIKASRLQNPVAPDLAEHLTNFLNLVKSTIASSFILDHYPPGMHAFKSSDVFSTLYKGTCAHAARLALEDTHPDLPASAFINLILKNMNSLYEKYLAGTSAAEIHLQALRKYASKWAGLRSERTCLVCIRRVPQYKLECGHRIYENCIKIFGKASSDNPWRFTADDCFLYQARSRITVLVLAPTAGIGVLCIDGGGVRGIIPITILERLEEAIRLPIPIQEHFKIALGISAGALIIPAMFLKGWRPAECTTAFEHWAGIAFHSGLLGKLRLFPTAGKVFFALLNNALYRAQYLKQVLKDTYGNDTKMLDTSYATSIGAKIGLPVATVSKPSTLLFTNFNGVGEEAVRHGYNVHQGADDVNVWEVARGCTAAPAYFKPKHIEGVGLIQDAAVFGANPLTLAFSELHAAGVSAPQFLINLGTGSAGSPGGPQEDQRPEGKIREALQQIVGDNLIVRLVRLTREALQQTVGNNFIVRLVRAYTSLITGRRSWEDFRRSIKRSSAIDRYFRLDVTFKGPEPMLDDVKIIPELKNIVRADEGLSQAINEIARCITASLFYFKLESVPEQRSDGFSGAGHILCFRKRSDPALEALSDKLARSSARFLVNGVAVPGDITDPSFWDGDGNFKKRITFKVNKEIVISLRVQGCREHPISGAPFSVSKLVTAQGLNAHFRKRELHEDGPVCLKRKRLLRSSKAYLA